MPVSVARYLDVLCEGPDRQVFLCNVQERDFEGLSALHWNDLRVERCGIVLVPKQTSAMVLAVAPRPNYVRKRGNSLPLTPLCLQD